jgi:RHS repeat-associated protein
LGSPPKLTDASQATVWDGVFDPFGEEVAITGLAAMPMRFPGQYADEETGFSYNYFRNYEPLLGRYIQSDPIGLRGGINDYAYAFSSPIVGKDPFGLSVEGALSQLGDLLDWIAGTPNSPSYGPDDAVTQDLRETPGWADIWGQYNQAGCKNGTYCSNFQYGALVSTDNVVGQTVGSFCAKLSSEGSTVQVNAWNT